MTTTIIKLQFHKALPRLAYTIGGYDNCGHCLTLRRLTEAVSQHERAHAENRVRNCSATTPHRARLFSGFIPARTGYPGTSSANSKEARRVRPLQHWFD